MADTSAIVESKDASMYSSEEITVTLSDLAKMIDHSLLHPKMTDAEILAGLEVAKKYQTATACVKPYSVALAGKVLEGSGVAVCPVIGSPLQEIAQLRSRYSRLSKLPKLVALK